MKLVWNSRGKTQQNHIEVKSVLERLHHIMKMEAHVDPFTFSRQVPVLTTTNSVFTLLPISHREPWHRGTPFLNPWVARHFDGGLSDREERNPILRPHLESNKLSGNFRTPDCRREWKMFWTKDVDNRAGRTPERILMINTHL